MRHLLMALAAVCNADAQVWTIVPAASFAPGPVAPASIATGFSEAIVSETVEAGTLPLPTTLAGLSVSIRDSGGTERRAAIFHVARGQISFLIPEGTALGDATISLLAGDSIQAMATVGIAAVAPALFTANSSGSGAPAGLLLDAAGATQVTTELFIGATGLPRPFTNTPPTHYLLLFGTGFRGWRNGITATVGGTAVPVIGAVAQADFVGLDQVNLGPLPALEDRRGEIEVAITADGAAANHVLIAPNGPGAGQWGSRGELLEANSEMAVGSVAGRIFVLGGYPNTRQTQATVQLYDPARDTWERTTPMPVPLNHNMAASANGKLYMIGGQTTDAGSGNFSDRVFEYDPATREWSERSRMPTARGAGVAVVVEGKIYVAGGRPPRGADFAVYDPAADSWRTLPNLPTARNHLAGAAINGKVYIAGGRFEAGFTSPQSDALEVYDPSTGAWSAGARMLKPRGGVNGVEALGCLHVFGGEGNAGASNGLHADHDVYNPLTGTWTRLAPMPTPVHGVTGAVFLGGLIHLPGGGTSQGGNSGARLHQVYRPEIVCR